MAALLVLAWSWPDGPWRRGLSLTYCLRRHNEPGSNLSPELRTALERMGTNAAPFLVRMLQTEDAFPDRWLAGVFRARGWGEPPIRLVWEDHLAAAKAFGVLGPAGARAIPELARLIEDPERTHPVAQALAGIGPVAVPALTNALASSNAIVRRGVAFQIRRLDTNAGPAIPALLGCLRDPDLDVAKAALQTLAHLRREQALVLPALAAQFDNPRPVMRSWALSAVAAFRNEAAGVLPAVLERLADPQPAVREAAVSAACCIHPAPKEMLLERIRHPDPRVRLTAARGLGRWGRRDTNVFDAVTQLLADEAGTVREEAAQALHAMDRMRARRLQVPFPGKPDVTKPAAGVLNPGR